MANVAVFHDRLDLFGGGEAVCVAVLEALQETHEVTLYTRRLPHAGELNDYFDASVDFARGVDVRTTADVGGITAVLGLLGRTTDETLGVGLNGLRRAAFVRAVARRVDDADVVVSTSGEFGFDAPAILYYHKLNQDPTGLEALRQRVTDALTGSGSSAIEGATLLANSEWTADDVERRRGARPRVVYPPVATSDFGGGASWEAREPGFVSVGRIDPEKNVLRNVEIVRRVRDRGHDVHLHLVGPVHDGAYGERVAAVARDHGFVHLEGRLSRADLVATIQGHRYGLHGREPEHFGIAVAELLAGGTIPFVPDSGGQREIVDGRDEVLYDSVDDAVAKIDAVLSDPDRQRSLRHELPDVEARFGRERFKREVREVTDAVLSGRPGSTPQRERPSSEDGRPSPRDGRTAPRD